MYPTSSSSTTAGPSATPNAKLELIRKKLNEVFKPSLGGNKACSGCDKRFEQWKEGVEKILGKMPQFTEYI